MQYITNQEMCAVILKLLIFLEHPYMQYSFFKCKECREIKVISKKVNCYGF